MSLLHLKFTMGDRIHYQRMGMTKGQLLKELRKGGLPSHIVGKLNKDGKAPRQTPDGIIMIELVDKLPTQRSLKWKNFAYKAEQTVKGLFSWLR